MSLLQKNIKRLLRDQPNDARLRDHLEGLSRTPEFPSLTWFWGPLLYERNRALFRSMILNHFSQWQGTGIRWRQVRWKEHSEELESWLSAARQHRDVQLVRRLLTWKHAKNWGVDTKTWFASLIEDYQNAKGPAARAIVLDEYDSYFQLDETTALSLYETDRRSSSFILKHLPSMFFWGGDKRVLWTKLVAAAEAARDDTLHWSLYRKQVPIKQWSVDVMEIADQIIDAEKLHEQLLLRHPEGHGLDLDETFVQLLERRGRVVLPYVRAKLKDVFGGWHGSKKIERLTKLAERKEWWDLWAVSLRINPEPDFYNKAIGKLLSDKSLAEADRIERLRMLAGVSQEWNWGGFSFAQVHSLKDEIAVRLYDRYPSLIHGPFKPNVQQTHWQGFAGLIAAAKKADDTELVDSLASRYATRVFYDWSCRGKEQAVQQTCEQLANYYLEIQEHDRVEFARRAANVLTRIPAFSIYDLKQLLATNPLARLLFVRSFQSFLDSPEAVRDLVEGSDIHVQKLAYRILAQPDKRAGQIAVESLEILEGTLLRPLHRKTRLAAFGALAAAAAVDLGAATRVLAKARVALRLPDKKYPKEELIGLIARVLQSWPQLAGDEEKPVVYGLVEANA